MNVQIEDVENVLKGRLEMAKKFGEIDKAEAYEDALRVIQLAKDGGLGK